MFPTVLLFSLTVIASVSCEVRARIHKKDDECNEVLDRYRGRKETSVRSLGE